MILWLTEIVAENLFTAKLLAENYLDIVSSVSIKNSNNNNHNHHHTKTSYSSFMSFITCVKPIIIFSIRLIVDVSWTPPCDVVLSKTINVIFIYTYLQEKPYIFLCNILYIYTLLYTAANFCRNFIYFRNFLPDSCVRRYIKFRQ